MTLMERVRQAGNDYCLNSSSSCSVERLREQIQELISVDDIALLVNENPQRARNELRIACEQAFADEAWASVPGWFRKELVEDLMDSVFGFGPIESLLADKAVTEVMVNGSKSIYFEKEGKLYRSDAVFRSDDQVRALIDRIVGPLGRRVDEASPMVSARLPQGHRVHAVIPPLALDGPMLTIRVFPEQVMTLDDFVACGSIDEELRTLLEWSVRSRKNIAVSGGTGSGKTTLLNALSCCISPDERIITIEDSAELRFLEHPHVVRLEARAKNAEGLGEVTIRDLVATSLRMRPDRIIVGECRGGEALDMLQAMNTGHAGSLTTMHANAPREAIDRLVTMVRYAADLPVDVIETHIADALDLVVQTTRFADGTRCVSNVSEVQFNPAKRMCRMIPLYRRSYRKGTGTWHQVPSWIAVERERGVLEAEEVDEWFRRIGFAQQR